MYDIYYLHLPYIQAIHVDKYSIHLAHMGSQERPFILFLWKATELGFWRSGMLDSEKTVNACYVPLLTHELKQVGQIDWTPIYKFQTPFKGGWCLKKHSNMCIRMRYIKQTLQHLAQKTNHKTTRAEMFLRSWVFSSSSLMISDALKRVRENEKRWLGR